MKYLYRGVGIILGVVVMEAAYFAVVLSSPDHLKPAGVIAVFSGSSRRVEVGVKLQRLGFAPHLVISPFDGLQLAALPPKVSEALILESRARTTFENALYTRDIVVTHNIRSVILVTSGYHAPRAYLLLKCLLMGRNVPVSLYKVADMRDFSTPIKIRNLKILYNEMVKLWGSLGELAAFSIRGRVPETPTRQILTLQIMRSLLLFKV